MANSTVCPTSTDVCPADTITRLRENRLTVLDAHVDDKDRTDINCTLLTVDDTCPGCGFPGRGYDTAIRHLVDIPISGHPCRLTVRFPRLECTNPDCGRTVWRTPLSCAAPRAKLTYRCIRWALKKVAVDGVSAAAVSRQLGVAWSTIHTPLAKTAWQLVYNDP